ncbi:MAG: ComEC/Rec2 family competence protein [Saprospiraceae bacterium]|jgi:competence protein ComEC
MLAYTLARPFIYLFLGLCLSIAATNLYYSLYYENTQANSLVSILFASILLIAILKKKKSIALVTIAIFLFCLNEYVHLNQVHDLGPSSNSPKFQKIEFKITSDNFINKKHSCIAIANINNKDVQCKISFQDRSINYPLQYGDMISGSICLNKINGSSSRTFNTYPDYLLNKHIYYEGFMSKIDHFQSASNYSLYKMTQYLATQIKNILIQTCSKPENANLLVSLILGDKTDLNKDTKQAFLSTGTAHILAVSGLHLGLVYYLLSLVCKPIRKLKNKNSKLMESILILTGIWAFALITGLGSSILRAAVMFSFIQVSNCLKRKNDSVNTLFACGFFMAAYNPCILSDIGFQLSFSAVLSIIWFNPYFNRIWLPKAKLLLPIRDLFSISCSVQVLVSPISIFYFQQFPLYFLISNLIWIPLSFLLMILGSIQVFLFAFSQKLASFIGIFSEELIQFGVGCLKCIQKAPYSILDNIWITDVQAILILCSFIFLKFYFITQNSSMLIKSLVLAVSVCLSTYYTEYTISKSRELVLYKYNNAFQMELREGHHTIGSSPNSNTLSKYRSLNKINHTDSITLSELIALTSKIQEEVSIHPIKCSMKLYCLKQKGTTKILHLNNLTEANAKCIQGEDYNISTYLNMSQNNPIIIKLQK